MHTILSLLNVIRKIINLLVAITSLYAHPPEASTSALSDAKAVLRREEIDSHPCFKEN